MTDPYLAEVRWLDAVRTDEGVTGREGIGAIRETAGWVLRSDSDGVIIAMTRDDKDGAVEYERGFFIPRPYVKCVRRLR